MDNEKGAAQLSSRTMIISKELDAVELFLINPLPSEIFIFFLDVVRGTIVYLVLVLFLVGPRHVRSNNVLARNIIINLTFSPALSVAQLINRHSCC